MKKRATITPISFQWDCPFCGWQNVLVSGEAHSVVERGSARCEECRQEVKPEFDFEE